MIRNLLLEILTLITATAIICACATQAPHTKPEHTASPQVAETPETIAQPAPESARKDPPAPPPSAKPAAPSAPDPDASRTIEEKKAPAPEEKPRTKTPPAPLKTVEKSDQELLDSALGFLQAADDYWGRGELGNAIDALDEAYSLILLISPDSAPDILQQRDDLRVTISKRIVEVYSSRYTVANGLHTAIPLETNRHVDKALSLLKGRHRDFFIAAYRRSGKYRPAILAALKDAGLPEELSWLPLIESGFKVRALSRARALGMWQFIASTGYKYGLKRDRWTDERMDPEKSTAAAIAYLTDLHQIFGDWTTALAAYNCGEGRVLRVIGSQKINYLDNFWDLYRKLPRETAFYVPKFLAVLHIVSDPAAHGFTLPPVAPQLRSEKVKINKQVHLKTIAKRLEISERTMKDLNPELRYNSTPNRPYDLRVPPGKSESLMAAIDKIPVWKPATPAYVRHKVRKGETLSGIAKRYHTSVGAIMRANGLRKSSYIKAGWTLKVPTRRTYASARPAGPPSKKTGQRGGTVTYRVRKGDSLWRIANRYGTTVNTIKSLNNLKSTRLQEGQILRIREKTETVTAMNTRAYTVRKGDSPYLIAREHHMDLSEFLRLNNLTPRSTIFPSQVLLVKAR
ncbi:MAG: LysM peptidoglycan-binding domain-containing protein [Deltaproteobacteria bacterium]|nr:LysM peptidoglycan-binding domain-containing protein [Deltaproteobacteria bacterium]